MVLVVSNLNKRSIDMEEKERLDQAVEQQNEEENK